MSERRAPVQGEGWRGDPDNHRPPGTVSWAEHQQAWDEYHRHHREQSAVRIAARGGFGWSEMKTLLGHDPETWRPDEDENHEARADASRRDRPVF